MLRIKKNDTVQSVFLSLIVLAALLLPVATPAAPTRTEAAATNSSPSEVLGPPFVPVPRPLRKGWMGRHEQFVGEAKEGGVDILFLGDSITDFWRNRGSNVWNKYYTPRHAVDFGISADRTQHLLWRIENGELSGIHPRVAVLMIGTNNTDKDSPEEIARAIRQIIDDIHAKTPETKVLLLGIFPRGPHGQSVEVAADAEKRMKTIRATNELIAKYDDGGKTVKYLDIGDKFLGSDGKIPDDVMPDQLHPSEKGYQIWADAMNPTLDQLLKGS